jgi:ABC-2 type transport system permease protein
MKKRNHFVKPFLVFVGIVLVVNILSFQFYGGIDLTSEKRFTVSEPTKKLVASLEEPMVLTVYLKGEMPTGFKRLANAAEDLANAFKAESNGNFDIVFERPGVGLEDTAKALLFDSLQRMGINPTNVKAQLKKGEQTEETLLFPGAILTGRGRQVAIDFLEGQSNLNGLESLNTAEALLEYKIAKAIIHVRQDTLPMVGYLVGNGEPLDMRVYDLIERVLRKEYRFSIIPIDSIGHIPEVFDAVVLAKPTKQFNSVQKLKIDQYIMNGGKMLWAVDNLFASMDSLQRSSGSFIAFDMGLNLDDQLFRYGVRINRDLVQDLESDKVPSVIGSVGGKPQIELLPWPYAPLLRDGSGHPISKNLDYVLSSFPQSIDTVAVDGIKNHLLLTTSDLSRSLQTPAMVEWKSIKNEEDLSRFTKKQIPVAVLLEGKFRSVFSNRLSKGQLDTLRQMQQKDFLNACNEETKMIVLSDADILLNGVSEQDGPLPMGMNSYTREQFANKEFISNSLFYLTAGADIMGARAKTYQLRLLDKSKLESDRVFWQFVNILMPLAFPFLLALIFPYLRKRKFGYQS